MHEAVQRAITHDRAMRAAQAKHKGTWASALAVQDQRRLRDAARASIPKLTVVRD